MCQLQLANFVHRVLHQLEQLGVNRLRRPAQLVPQLLRDIVQEQAQQPQFLQHPFPGILQGSCVVLVNAGTQRLAVHRVLAGRLLQQT